MKKILSLRNVLFVVGSLAFLTAILLWATPFSFVSVILIAFIATALSSAIFLFDLNAKLYARWPWMKSTWFTITQRTLAICLIAYGLYVILT